MTSIELLSHIVLDGKFFIKFVAITTIDMHKIMIIEITSSCVKNCTQPLEIDLKFRILASQGQI